MVVEGADIANGMLHVTIRRVVPEALKPRRIEVKTAQPSARTIAAAPAQQDELQKAA